MSISWEVEENLFIHDILEKFDGLICVYIFAFVVVISSFGFHIISLS